jgi:branched-chain amino acid aminotransferase
MTNWIQFRNQLPEIVVWKTRVEPRYSHQLQRVKFQTSPITLDEASQLLPSGVYTTFRTFDGDKILSLQNQVNRLEESAGLVGCSIQIRVEQLREALREAVSQYPSEEKRVRVSMDLQTGDVYILIEQLKVPDKILYEHGVHLVTVRHERQNPRAKRTLFIDTAESIRKNYPTDINDILMVNKAGFILEGLNSNFFAVQDGIVFTAGENVLSGITRETVLGIIRQLEIPLNLSPIHIHDLRNIEEAFLTSASRSVLPIAQIDQVWIEGPKPGPITDSITTAYWKYVDDRLEDL